MNKKWIALPVAALALMSLGAPIANQNTTGVHASETHHESFDEYMAKRVTFFNHKQSFHIHGRVTPVQLNRYLRDQGVNIDKATNLIYGNGKSIDLVKDTPNRPLWQYCSLTTRNAAGEDVKSGQNSNNSNNEIWLDGNMSPSASVHMRTPMNWGYYYLSNHEDTSTLDFVYNGKTIGRSNYSLGFDVPNTPDSHYHGTFNQFLANVHKYHVDVPSGYKMVSHRPRVVKIDNYKYNNHFPDPIIKLKKITEPSAPVFYNEGGRLVNAGAVVKNVTPSNVGSEVKNSKLDPPTDNYSVAPNAQPSLKKNGAGQEYVEIPTNAPKAAPKKAPETSAPVEYDEGGHLIYAGDTLSDVTPDNLSSKLSGAPLSTPTSGYKVDTSKQPSLKKNGNDEYVDIPTIADTPKPSKTIPKTNPQPAPKQPSTNVSNPTVTARMYWVRSIKTCKLYTHMNTKTGNMSSVRAIVHPYYTSQNEKLYENNAPYNTFHVIKIYDYSEPNGKSLVRYKVRLNGHDYFITGNDNFIIHAYYQPGEVKDGDELKVKLPCVWHVTMYNGTVVNLHKGDTLHITGDTDMGTHNRYRFTATYKSKKGLKEGHVTANKNYVDDVTADKRAGHSNNEFIDD